MTEKRIDMTPVAADDERVPPVTDESYPGHLHQFTSELLRFVLAQGVAKGFHPVDVAGVMSGVTSVIVRDSGAVGIPVDPAKVEAVQQIMLHWNQTVASAFSIRPAASDETKKGMI